MKLVSSLLIASALASAVSVSLAIAQPVPPRLPSGTAKQPPALEGRPSAPPAPPPGFTAFRASCTPNPTVAPLQHKSATCDEIRQARSFAPYLFDSCVKQVYTAVEEMITALDSLDPFKTLDARDGVVGLVESAAGGLAGYLIGCTTEGFVAAVAGQFPSTESALVAAKEKAMGAPEIMRSRDPVAITRFIYDFRGSLEAARSEATNVRDYFERGLYQSTYDQARDAITRSGNIVAASVKTETCDMIGADREARSATDLAMQHVVAMRRELAENEDKLRCAVEYLRTTALAPQHRFVQEMAVQRLTRDVRQMGPQRVRDAEALLADAGRQCARVHEATQRCANPPDTTRSAGVCAGQLAGDWRVTQRMATGRHEQDWTITADGRAAPKGSQFPPQARGHITDRRLVIAERDAARNYVDYIVAELEPSCIRGTGSITTMISSQLGARKEQMEIRRLGEPSAVASPSGGPPAPPLRPDAAIVTPGVGPQISPQAGVPQGSPLPTQPTVPQPLGQQPVAPPPAAAPTVACNQLVGAPIYAKWAQLGGERGLLGCAMHGQVQATTSPQGTPGTYVRFQHGIITYMAGGARANQAYEVHGRILDAYGQLGGSASWLGFPVSDEYDVAGGRRSDFEGGYIFWDRATNQTRAERSGSTAVASCDASGVWQASTERVGTASWTLTPSGAGRYTAREQGLGNATGTAIVSGSRLRIDWTTSGHAGHYEWDLGAGCAGGGGTLVFTQGASGSHGSRIARAPATAAAPPAPPQPTAGSACGFTLSAAIFAKWQQLGGERGFLGCPTMNEAEAGRSPQGTSGRYVNFRGGGMTVTTSGARAGQAFEYHGLIYQAYAQLGGSLSWLGFPVSDEYDVAGGRRSDFEGGYIFWDRATNQARAERPGAPVAAVGPPAGCDASGVWQATTERVGAASWTLTPSGAGRYTAREQGLGNATGTAIVSGSRLRIDWTTGGHAGNYEWDLGAGCAGGGGTLVFTQGASGSHGSRIARATATAAAPPQPPPATAGSACGYTLGGGIYRKWQETGGERGSLGCPTRNEGGALPSPQGSTGTWADFQRGLITWTVTGSRANQAFEVRGAIKNLYMQMGGSGGLLGFPVSDEYDVPGGRRSDFEGGYIFWDRATNQVRAERGAPPATAAAPPAPQPAAQATPANACGHTLGSGIFGKWQQLGGERGLLGCPTMSEADANRSPQGSTGKWANFQHGLITWMFTGPKVNQGFEVHGLIKNLYMQMGGSGSWLGFPVSDEYDAAGGRRSDFEGGYIFWNRATNQARAERPGAPAAQQPPAPVVTEGHVPAPAGGVNYPNPRVAGTPVDHCVTWATNCGQAGADQFCRSQGHARAASFQVFSPGRTYVMGDRRVCQGPHCVGFAQVVCAR